MTQIQTVLGLYESLFTVRKSEEAVLELYPTDVMKTPMHMSLGQEAPPVGVCGALRADDPVTCSYRSHSTFLAKTADTDRFFAEMYGRTTGTANGKGGSMHLALPEKGLICASAIVASQIPIAAGLAFASKYNKKDQVAATFFGDGAIEEGAFWETVNVASMMELPLLFVCEDNGFAVHTPPTNRHGFDDICDVVGKFRCDVRSIDTTLVEEIYDVAKEMIDKIRETKRPGFLRVKCYRYLSAVGVTEDYSAGYRTREEGETWKARDPVTTQRARLLSHHGVSEDQVQNIEHRVTEKIRASIQFAHNSPLPGIEQLYKGVFFEGP